MAKKKKYTLTIDYEIDFDLIGICSHHNDYRLAWNINEKIGLNLAKCDEDYVLTDKKGEAVSNHSMYSFEDEENRLTYYLIKNKHQGKFLIPEKPSIDYFLFLHDNIAIELDELMNDLKSVPSILGVYEFDPVEIGSAENIVF
ncbi:MAG: hypothetical protein ACJA1C_002197 [Crocinitomicaceae bacterium]|jgi:hypothetical protein